jgi:hypothetical protein
VSNIGLILIPGSGFQKMRKLRLFAYFLSRDDFLQVKYSDSRI